MTVFKLKLQKTYYNMGFFNVTREYDHLVRQTEGRITVVLENTGQTLQGTLDRHANGNNTARIRVGSDLREWFHRYFQEMDIVNVDLSSQNTIRLSKPQT